MHFYSSSSSNVTSKATAMKILEMEDSEYEIHDVKEALKKRYDEIGNQQKMCDFLKKSFHEDSKEFAKVTKVECRILNDKLEVKYV